MSIIYVCVAVRSTLLAEHCILATNTITPAAKAILEKIPPTVDRMTYAYREYFWSFSAPHFVFRYFFHYIIQDGVTYLCMATASLDKKVAFAFLHDIGNRFNAMYGQRAKTAFELEMQNGFLSTLQATTVRSPCSQNLRILEEFQCDRRYFCRTTKSRSWKSRNGEI